MRKKEGKNSLDLEQEDQADPKTSTSLQLKSFILR